MNVLIATTPVDYHSHAVKWAIERLGARCSMFYALDLCDGARWSFDPAGDALLIEHKEGRQVVELGAFDTVWMRRPGGIFPQARLEDTRERATAEEEFSILASSVLKRLEYGKFVVNPGRANRACSLKPAQFTAAARVGLPLPQTLISNSRDEILDFFHRNDRRIVYKPIKNGLWPKSDGFTVVPTTAITDQDLLLKSDLAAAPGIFQQIIDKRVEVRATIMGRSIFAWEKSFADRDDLDVDWRFMHRGAISRKHVLPRDLEDRCFALMDELELVFGCFDFVIDSDGQYSFLEVNPQGQWLWGDALDVGVNQLQAMAEFLMSGDPKFKASGVHDFRIHDFDEAEYGVSIAVEQEQHYGNVMTFFYDRLAVPSTPMVFPLPQTQPEPQSA